MTHFAFQLAHKLADAFADLGLSRDLGAVVRAQKAEFGHFQCNGAMAGAKQVGKNHVRSQLPSRAGWRKTQILRGWKWQGQGS